MLPHSVSVPDQKSFCSFACAEISNVRNNALLVSVLSYDSCGGVRWNGTPANPNNPSHVAFVSTVCDPGSLRQEQPTGSEASKAPSHYSTDKRLCSRTRAYKITADTPLLCCPWTVSLKFFQYLTLNTFERAGGGVEWRTGFKIKSPTHKRALQVIRVDRRGKRWYAPNPQALKEMQINPTQSKWGCNCSQPPKNRV